MALPWLALLAGAMSKEEKKDSSSGTTQGQSTSDADKEKSSGTDWLATIQESQRKEQEKQDQFDQANQWQARQAEQQATQQQYNPDWLNQYMSQSQNRSGSV